MTIDYSASQADALSVVPDWITSQEPFLRLRGSAGTGKSTITKEIVSMLPKGKTIGVVPTHKAGEQLQKCLGPDIRVITIDSFLGLKPKKSGRETITVRHNKYDPSAYNAYDFALLDEAFMNGTAKSKFVLDDIRQQNRRYLLVGDECQLAPVGELDSPLNTLQIPEKYDKRLTEVHRFGGGILKVATDIRNAIVSGDYGAYPLDTYEEGGKGVYVLKPDAWGDEIKAIVRQPEFVHQPDTLKVLAYSNDAVIDYENRIARILGRSPAKPFEVGDMVVVNEALTQGDQVILRTGEDVEIMSVKHHEHPVYQGLEGWEMTVKRSIGELVSLVALDQTLSREAWKWTLNNLASQAESGQGGWYKYYALAEYFADIRQGTACTVHKMQGSQADVVAIDYANLFAGCGRKDFDWAQADRLLYTAITRARSKVLIKM